MALTTKEVKDAMNQVWNYSPDLMVECFKDDSEYPGHYAAQEMNTSLTIQYKYTVDSEQIEEVQQLLDGRVVILVSAMCVEVGCVTPYMSVTACYCR